MRAADRQLKSPGALGEPGLRRRNRQVLGGKKVTLCPVIQRLPAIVGSLSAYTVERDGGAMDRRAGAAASLTLRLPCRRYGWDASLNKLIKRPRAKAPRPRN